MISARSSRLAAALVVLSAMVLASCGEDDSLGEQIPVTDDMLMPEWSLIEFAIEGDLVVPEGELTAAIVNDGFVEHNVGLEGGPFSETLWVTGETTTLDLGELAPGDYVLYCDIDGHRTSGMEATLTVLPVADGVMTVSNEG